MALRELPIMRLESLARHWEFDAYRYARWEVEARRAFAPYADTAMQLAQRRAAWSATRAAGLLDGLPPILSQRRPASAHRVRPGRRGGGHRRHRPPPVARRRAAAVARPGPCDRYARIAGRHAPRAGHRNPVRARLQCRRRCQPAGAARGPAVVAAADSDPGPAQQARRLRRHRPRRAPLAASPRVHLAAAGHAVGDGAGAACAAAGAGVRAGAGAGARAAPAAVRHRPLARHAAVCRHRPVCARPRRRGGRGRRRHLSPVLAGIERAGVRPDAVDAAAASLAGRARVPRAEHLAAARAASARHRRGGHAGGGVCMQYLRQYLSGGNAHQRRDRQRLHGAGPVCQRGRVPRLAAPVLTTVLRAATGAPPGSGAAGRLRPPAGAGGIGRLAAVQPVSFPRAAPVARLRHDRDGRGRGRGRSVGAPGRRAGVLRVDLAGAVDCARRAAPAARRAARAYAAAARRWQQHRIAQLLRGAGLGLPAGAVGGRLPGEPADHRVRRAGRGHRLRLAERGQQFCVGPGADVRAVDPARRRGRRCRHLGHRARDRPARHHHPHVRRRRRRRAQWLAVKRQPHQLDHVRPQPAFRDHGGRGVRGRSGRRDRVAARRDGGHGRRGGRSRARGPADRLRRERAELHRARLDRGRRPVDDGAQRCTGPHAGGADGSGHRDSQPADRHQPAPPGCAASQ
uniref:Uncharacterized protein n=1 Tax=Tanacetum cinerariifolium TaxID=118510 RepID=A0A699GEG5_TANCI|nr:hypothetical protein [Tanacetum cinerariifolium]